MHGWIISASNFFPHVSKRGSVVALVLVCGLLTGATHQSAASECLYGESLEIRLADAWRRWGLEGERMRDCDAEALQDALEVVRGCGGP